MILALFSVEVFINASLKTRDAQEILMHEFFSGMSDAFIHNVSAERSLSTIIGWPDHPNWKGVGTSGGIVEKVEYSSIRNCGTFHLYYLPQAVQKLFIKNCTQKIQNLDTRMLPRSAVTINLSTNAISGRLNLCTLPANLEVLDLTWNRIVGPISLTQLPRNLHQLDLSCNRIQQKAIYYGNLPDSLLLVGLWSQNGLRDVKALGEVPREKRKIFKGLAKD